MKIQGIYEVAIKVKALETAEHFYREVLGLQVGLRDDGRRWVFLRVGGAAGMLVLQEERSNWPTQHFAFTIDEKDLESACRSLTEMSVEFEGPVFHEWMPAQSIYFSDPDGHDLELCAPTSKTKRFLP